jgi:undecaprenyl-diphosphatase
VPVALPVLLAAAAYAVWRARSPGPAIRAGLVMAAVPAVVVPMKWALARPGPLTDATGYYPSGHAATAAVAYCGAGLLLVPYVRHRYRTLPLVAAVLLTAANGAGLVLHGYHWPLDVAASWCLSALLLRGVLVRRSSRPAHPTSDYVSDMTQGPHN